MQASIVRKNGQLSIDIDGRLYPPLSFKSFRPNPQNIREFHEAGVRLFTVLSSGIICALGVPYSRFGESWVGDGQYDFAPIDRQMDMFLANAPEGYFAPMFQIDTRPWYMAARADCPNSFTHLSQIAGDTTFQKDAAAYLQAVVTHCEEKYGQRIWGYFLLGGHTTEWFSDCDYEAPHPWKEAAFRRYLRDDHATLPTKARLDSTGPVFLEKDEGDIVQFREFHARLISDLVLHCAAAVQDVIHHQKLVGLYFGYLFELGTPRLHNAGHLDYERVFASPDIDMISSPSAYGYRKQTDPSAFMVTQKTLDRQNKLYFLEFDHRTHTAPAEVQEPVEDTSGNMAFPKIPGWDSGCQTEQESINLLYRDFLLCEAHGAALWWFDMFDGWFRSPGMMAAIHHMIEIDKAQSMERHSVAQVAVFCEGGSSMYHVRKTAPIASVCLGGIRQTLADMGAPYDLYSIGDLPAIDHDRYRFYIFVDAYCMTPETRRCIEEKCQREGKSILWLYAPDYATHGENDVDRIAAMTGIQVTQAERSPGRLVWNGQTGIETAAPYFTITDPDATVYARFENGTAGVAGVVMHGYRSIYAATYHIPGALLRTLLQESGIFLYSEWDRVYTYVNAAFVGVYNATDADAVVHMPTDGTYVDLLTDKTFSCEKGTLRLPKRGLWAYMLQKRQV